MQLTTVERLILLQILPRQGDFTTLKIIRRLQEALSFSEEEHAALELRTENGSVRWRPDVDRAKDVEIGPKAAEVIRDQFRELDRKKALMLDHMGVYERFMLATESEEP